MSSWIQDNKAQVTSLYNRLTCERERICRAAVQMRAVFQEEALREGASLQPVQPLSAEELSAATKTHLMLDSLFATLVVYESQRAGIELPNSDETLLDWIVRFEPLFELFLDQDFAGS